MSKIIEAQCFGCVDDLSYMYHGVAYNSGAKSQEYIKAYQELGNPIIACQTCGEYVNYEPTSDGKWTQVYVEGAS